MAKMDDLMNDFEKEMRLEESRTQIECDFLIRFQDEWSICESHILNNFSEFLHDEDVNGDFDDGDVWWRQLFEVFC